ncbi:MAG: DUF1697 domain-containing protein, partial [Acidimicrobiaceae bacterium]|nr:DUF1697 domain-containing protein [Acidimicrobiaceae bacterium]
MGTQGPVDARSVALLRGINVGGRRKVSMTDLAAAFTAAGCSDVATYIQSGNVVFRPPAGGGELVAKLESVVADMAGFEVPIVVRSGAALAGLLAGQPFPLDDAAHLHVCFLGAEPSSTALTRFAEAAVPPEAFSRSGLDVYLHLPGGMGRSKLGLAVDRLAVPVTVRNWRTVQTLAEMAGA